MIQKKEFKKTAIRIIAALCFIVLFCVFVVYLLVAGHVAIGPTPSFLTEGTGVTKSRFHSFGWEDTCYLVRMEVSEWQLKAVIKKYNLKPIHDSGHSELSLRKILVIFLDENPYWWNVAWNKDIRFYEAERDISGYYARAVFDPRSRILLLRYYNT